MFTVEDSNGRDSSNGVAVHSEAHLDLAAPLEMQDQYTSELSPFAVQQMQHDSDYVEDVNLKMRIPTKLTVASHDDDNDQAPGYINGDTSYSMEVPDKIVVSVGDDGVQYGRSRDMSKILFDQELRQAETPEPVSLVTPPRKLTLAERNLDALDVQEHRGETAAKTNHDTRRQNPSSGIGKFSPTILKSLQSTTSQFYERVLQVFDDENPNAPVTETSDTVKPMVTTSQASSSFSERTDTQQIESTHTEELDDVSLMRRQLFKLHRRITAIEKLEAERSKRDTYVYAVSIALIVVNGWLLYTSRRPY